MAAPRTLTLADGQLGASAASILAGGDLPGSVSRVNISLANTSSIDQTVVLTFQRAGGTARRLCRAVLKQDEQLLVYGLAIQGYDTLLGQATGASSVDYLISVSAPPDGGPPFVLAADGTPKRATTISVTVPKQVGLSMDGEAITALLSEMNETLMAIGPR